MAPLLGGEIAQAQFVAFNDHAPGTIGSTTSSNATTYNIFGRAPGTSGLLEDVASGSSLGVTLTITTNGWVVASSAAGNPSPGTPLYNVFNGYVDFQGAGNPDAAAQLYPNATVTYAFSGLNTNRVYSFIGSAVRGGSGGTYPQRWTTFALNGARGFQSAHTAGCYTNGLATNQVAINTGVNTNGDMADWENIIPAANGTLSVVSTQYMGPIPGGGTASGPYGYAMTGFRLVEFGPPTIRSAAAVGNNAAQIVFSVPVSAGTALSLTNYSITNLGGTVPILGAAFVNDTKTVQLTTATLAPYTRQWLTVSGIRDAATGLSVIAPNTQVLFTNVPFTVGYIQRQLYFNVTNGASVASLTNSPKFPNNPDQVDYPPSMGWPTVNIADTYGGRFSGYLTPPITGNYYFAVRSDDASVLYLSPNNDPTYKAVATSEPNCCEAFDAHTNGPFLLNAGQRYYIEGLMKENTGGDYFYVAWKTPTNLSWNVIPGSSLGNYLSVTNPALSISRQPTNTTGIADYTATFSVSASGNSAATSTLTYQWQVNGFDIPGATAASYTTPTLNAGDNAEVYRVLVAVPGKALFSGSATLTVVPDTVPPAVSEAFNLGATNVQLVFTKVLEPASAANRTNYVCSGGVTVTAAALDSTGSNVVLVTTPLVYGSNYSITINNVRDRAAVPNTIAPNTVASFLASPYTPEDIGNPSIPSTVTIVSNGVNVAAAGTDIGGAADQFSFNFAPRTGDFDVAARVAGLALSDLWAKAGLMARETFDAGSRFAASMATPGLNGCSFLTRDPAYSPVVTSGNFPVNYPSTWLRLKRAGTLFTGYASYDGQTWTLLGSDTIAMPSQLYVGLAVTSHNPAQTTSAQFRDIADVTTNSATGFLVNPHEPLGPSSRKTPIAISEIMYKPAPRTDGRNVEFMELYNSNPWFQDISGYQLRGTALSYTFPAGTVMPGGAFLVIAAAPADLQVVYGITNVTGPYTGSLKREDTLELIDEAGAVLLTVPYADTPPWPAAADGAGHSLVLANPSYGEGDPRAWDISDVVGGSPGAMEAYRPSPLRNVVINEFLAHTDPPDYDYIELYNHANQAVDVSGCILSDQPDTNKFIIPGGTSIPARGFIYYSETNMNFRLSAAGQTIYFKDPTQTRVLDCVRYGGQENGVATGRWPDGATQFYRLSAKTPGGSNAPLLISDVVINELMYKPISGDDDDQYIELYNRSASTLDLSNWILSDAVSFTFPANTLMAPGSYLVVGRNIARLFANYPNLNANNTLGNYSGSLSHNGEHLALAKPDYQVVTNGSALVTNLQMYITVNDVTYGTGGRWGQWANGGGSSLELRDPNSNNRLAANWGDSDETQKSVWTNIETTAVLDNGKNYDPSIDYAQIGLLDAGECLVDNIEVHPGTAATNYVANPDFESGLTNWILEGCHIRSSLENTGYQSTRSLHIRNSDRMWTGDNSCEVALTTNALASGQTATLRFKARWLRGWPEVLLRLNGNWLEATGRMPVPANLGTPGLPNSRLVANAGPAIYEVTHSPAVPATNQPVVVTARVHDPNPLQSFTLVYRLDPSLGVTSVPMTDDGTGGDAIAGDGVFSATIPAPNTNQIVAFYVTATDALGGSSRFPALLNNNSFFPPECVVMFGDSNPGGSFGVYHLWITRTNANLWSAQSDLSNESWDCTIVNNNRIIYNAQARFAGSPYHQGFNTPYGNLCQYKWIFPDDDAFLGATSFNKIHQPGNGAGDDASIQREQCANTFLRALGVPWLYRRHVAVYVNGNRRGTLMEDAQTPDADVVREHFPHDADGWLYKMQPWFEFAPAPKGSSTPFANQSWCNIMPYTTTGGAKKVARYRYNFLVRRTPTTANDFTNVFSLVDAAGTFAGANYVANMQNMADMENWMRVFAANHAAGNWDSFGAQNAQNLYGYIGTQGTKYSLLMFDFNIVLGNSGSWGPGQNLFTVNSQDSNMAQIYSNPTFRRMYWRALQELVNGPLDVANSGPLLDAKYAAFTANGLNVEDPNTNLKPWLTQARSSISSQIASANTGAFALSGITLNNNVAIVSGTAPFVVSTITFNGVPYPVTWNTVTTWIATVPLQPGVNQLSVVGLNRQGQPVPGASFPISPNYAGSLPSPVGQVVINEIMYQPARPNAEYIELFNNSAAITFDLSGWKLRGVGYTFPAGATIGPRKFLVLAANRAAFAAAYGATTQVFDTWSGTLSSNGELLSLVQPGTNSDLNVAQVQYSTAPPWPSNANGLGSSLQLIDATEDNWRPGNWAASGLPTAYTPGVVNSVTAALPAFPSLWLNELQADDLTGITNSAGQHTPWLELYNPTTNVVSLSGLYLANTYTNLTAWAFPTNASVNPGQFLVVFADGQTNLSTQDELHANFVLTSSNGSIALSRLYNSQPQVLDNLDYANLAADHSYGSFPDGQSFRRLEFWHVTPGAANDDLTFPSAIAYNVAGSIYQQNFDALPNPGLASVNSANPVTINGVTYSLANPYDFAFPAAPSGDIGGLGVSSLAGWYGLGELASKFGATFGDQTTGGQLSFGPADSTNRALGLLATSSTGATAFGARFINQTDGNLNFMNLEFTGELWRQSDKSKMLEFHYWVDLTGTNVFSTNVTAFLPALNVSFPTNASAVGGIAVDGTSPANQTNLSVVEQVITNWPPGAALWLVWAMTDPDGKAQGLGIDNFSFSASGALPNTAPVLAPIPSPLVILGQTLSFTASASDTDQPPQALTFTLNPDAPAGVTLSPTTGLFNWTPTDAPSTNNFTITVSDNGVPSLAASQSFTVTVFAPPQLQGFAQNGTQFSFGWLTLTGQVYQVEYNDDLSTGVWLPLGLPQAGTSGPLTATQDVSAASQRFFRVRVGP